jgi:Reverse transcriptase (RNA-dependent DNA polymerase)
MPIATKMMPRNRDLSRASDLCDSLTRKRKSATLCAVSRFARLAGTLVVMTSGRAPNLTACAFGRWMSSTSRARGLACWRRFAEPSWTYRTGFHLRPRTGSGQARLHSTGITPYSLSSWYLRRRRAAPTVRPFVRVHPRDLLLYQALVDALTDVIEATLGSPEEVFAYRLSLADFDNPIEGSPTFGDYTRAVLEYAEQHPEEYVVQADVASFFVSVRSDELERRLLAAGSNPLVVRDLHALLTGWQAEGVQGLPQGLLPSSVLGNFYLTSVDRTLRARNAVFWRYMDDIAVAARGFHADRQVLDQLEAELYEDGLSLGAAKTKVIRATSASGEFQTMRERLNEQFEEFLGEFGDRASSRADSRSLRRRHTSAASRRVPAWRIHRGASRAGSRRGRPRASGAALCPAEASRPD